MLERVNTETVIGGKGCSLCVFWQEYGDINKSLYGLVGKWGRCTNKKAIHDINVKFLTKDTTTNDRTKVDITRLNIESIIVATAHNYSCSNLRIKKDIDDRDETENKTTE